MKSFHNLSIKSKVTLIITLTSLIALLAACGILVVYELISDRNIMVRQLAMLAEVTGTAYIHSNLSEMYSRLRQHVGIVLAVLLVASIVAFLISARLQRVITGPVLKLSATARAVSEQKDYKLRAEKHSEDEVGVLI